VVIVVFGDGWLDSDDPLVTINAADFTPTHLAVPRLLKVMWIHFEALRVLKGIIEANQNRHVLLFFRMFRLNSVNILVTKLNSTTILKL